MNQVRLVLDKPTIIAQAPPAVKDWGYYQFPLVELLDDQNIHVSFHIEKDSATAYGKASAHYLSQDGGKSFTQLAQKPVNSGISLPNGERIRIKHLSPIPLEGLSLPKAFATSQVYGSLQKMYDPAAIALEYSGYPLERQRAGQTNWELEIKQISAPHELRYSTEGVLPRQMFWRLRQAPDQRIWALAYPYAGLPGRKAECMPVFFVSEDNGQTFQFLSSIPYQPIAEVDEYAEKRNGFTEPDLAFMPDGSIICLMRTQDGYKGGLVRAPLYLARSTDQGKTWSKPVLFDTLGVWPIIQTLENGVTLACYGRPGLYLRATADPAGLDWDGRITVLNPAFNKKRTCAYGGLVALDQSTAYFVYSDFTYPNEEGIPVKTILGCRVQTALE